MKIAILLLSGGVVERGAETAAYSLAGIFANLGHRVTIFQAGEAHRGKSNPYKTITLSLPIKPMSHKPKYTIGKVLERMNLNKRGIATLLFMLKVLPRLATDNFDLIIPIDGFWEILLCKLLQLFKSCQIMVIGLAGIGWTDEQNLKLKPDVFIALTEPMREWASKIQSKTKIVTIPLPVDSDRFNGSITPAEVNLPKPIVLTVAALTKYKRIDAVIRSVALLPDWSLLVIGQGEERQNLQQLGENLLGNRFQIIEVPHDSIAAYYRASDVFVLASQPQEAFGMVLLEAQACGLPIVTTNDVSRQWILAESVRYADPQNHHQLAQAIARAIEMHDPLTSQHNLERFSRLRVQSEYAELFQSFIA